MLHLRCSVCQAEATGYVRIAVPLDDGTEFMVSDLRVVLCEEHRQDGVISPVPEKLRDYVELVIPKDKKIRAGELTLRTTTADIVRLAGSPKLNDALVKFFSAITILDQGAGSKLILAAMVTSVGSAAKRIATVLARDGRDDRDHNSPAVAAFRDVHSAAYRLARDIQKGAVPQDHVKDELAAFYALVRACAPLVQQTLLAMPDPAAS